MRLFRYLIIVLIVCVLAIASPQRCLAQEETRMIASGQYFDVYGYAGIDIPSLLAALDYQSFYPGSSLTGERGDFSAILAKTLDVIYLETSDILDIHIYSYHGAIQFLPDVSAVDSIFYKYAGRSMHERSFYFHEKNTIYISVRDLELGVLGHEIAHAIISHYFVVPPPVKVQEVLCGYVDFNLRKSRGKILPKNKHKD